MRRATSDASVVSAVWESDDRARGVSKRIVWGSHKPSPIVCLIVTANIVAFIATAHGPIDPPAADLVAAGALTKSALQAGERWRLVAAGFLHASVPHLLTNLISLLAFGPTLERRVGPTAFALVYLLALVGGSVASVATHGAAFVGVGASGAIVGSLGALFALWILGKVHLHPRFFFINFALMGAINVPGSRVDWVAHLGGFAGGLISIALLDLFERAANVILRCRFPEFVKANTLGLIVVVGAALWPSSVFSLDAGQGMLKVAAWACLSVALALVLDVFLSMRRGLAVVTMILCLGNGLAASMIRPLACTMLPTRVSGTLDALTPSICRSPSPVIPCAAVFALSLLLYANIFRRGLTDVGFTSAMLMANRRRERGVRPSQS